MKTVMKKLVAAALVVAFAGFAWRSLPSPEQAQSPDAAQATVRGTSPSSIHPPLPFLLVAPLPQYKPHLLLVSILPRISCTQARRSL